MITTDQIKELRDKTGVSIMQCKKALEEVGGDMEKALVVLTKKSGEIAAKKSDRQLGAGVVQAYIHADNTVGALVELSCETDFVAKNEEFVTLARDIAMQITAVNPGFLKKEDISEEAKQKAKEVFLTEVEDKPEEMKEKILEGKLASYFKERVLLDQSFIKNSDISVNDLIQSAIQKFGEKIEVTNFSRFSASGK
ncbi:elongation factor Ts [Patescibacteria group bacterium]